MLKFLKFAPQILQIANFQTEQERSEFSLLNLPIVSVAGIQAGSGTE